MKKGTLILAVAATMIGFAACNNDKKDAGEYTQAQVDSMLQAKADSQKLAEQQYNDSMVTAEAQRIADSTNAALPPGSTTTVTTTVKTTKPPKTNNKPEPSTSEPTKPSTVGNGKPTMKADDNGTVGNGKPSMKPTQKTENGDKTVGNGKPSMK